jgi:hypothetical protein
LGILARAENAAPPLWSGSAALVKTWLIVGKREGDEWGWWWEEAEARV